MLRENKRKPQAPLATALGRGRHLLGDVDVAEGISVVWSSQRPPLPLPCVLPSSRVS